MAQLDGADQKAMDLVYTYRRVFCTPDGKVVLKDMLSDLNYNSSVGMDNAPLHNYAKFLLFKIGALQDHNEDAIVDALLDLPYLPPVNGDKE
jgi:hypothetical protein